MQNLLKRKKGQPDHSEDGVVAVIVALMLTVIFAFLSIAIDQSTWFVKQREYQNAADAAALAACDYRYKKNTTEEDAKKEGHTATELCQLPLDDTELSYRFDDANKKVVVTVRKPTDNYFSYVLSGKDQTMVGVQSTAGLKSISGENGDGYAMNAAIEGRKGLNWNNGEATVNGGMLTGGDLSCCGAGFNVNGMISCDGNLNVSNRLVVSDSVLVGGNYSNSLNTTAIRGSMQVSGNFSDCSNGATYQDVAANGTISIGDENTTKTKIQGTRTSGAGLSDSEKPVTHSNYVWRWDDFKTKYTYDSSKSEQPYTVLSQEMFNRYVDWFKTQHPDKKDNIGGMFSYSGGNLYVNNDADFTEFINYCKTIDEAHQGEDKPIYIPGSFTSNCNGITFSGDFVVQNDISINSEPDGTMNASFYSLEGNINITTGKTLSITGMVMTLADENSSSGNITLNANGANNQSTITGGVIASNTITMSGQWTLTAAGEARSMPGKKTKTSQVYVALME